MNTYEIRITKTVCHYFESIAAESEAEAVAHAHRLAYETSGHQATDVWVNRNPDTTGESR